MYRPIIFILCMFCQGLLHKARPADSRNLTIFYLVISLGGFVGGIAVSWIIPLLTASMIEFLVGLVFISFALVVNEKDGALDFRGVRFALYPVLLAIIWPIAFQRYTFPGITLICVGFALIFSQLTRTPRALNLSLVVILFLVPFLEPLWTLKDLVHSRRNYYGIHKVYDEAGKRFLMHGTTIHGVEYLAKEKERAPLAYYHRATPIGKLLSTELFRFHDIGIVGLGTGGLTAYAHKEQTIDFFELDPDVYDIASRYFNFLKTCPATLSFTFGDARVSLDTTRAGRYDLLIVDAFSGDSIPVHLLTTEAIAKYQDHLKDSGMVVFHVSNRYLDLIPVLFSNAAVVKAYVAYDSSQALKKVDAFASTWVALTWDKGIFERLISGLTWRRTYPDKSVRPWTDGYSNLLSVFKSQDMFSSIKEFRPFYW